MTTLRRESNLKSEPETDDGNVFLIKSKIRKPFDRSE